MSPEQRINLTRYIWTSLMITIAAIAIFAGNTLSGLIIPIIIFLVGAAIPITGFVLNFGNLKQSNDLRVAEKSKRNQKLNKLLDQLSDEDLEALRRHLAYEDEPYGISEDGELMYMEKR